MTRTISEHTQALLELISAVPTYTAALTHRLAGSVLAESPLSLLPVPPFSNSAMDGFLVHTADIAMLPVTLDVAGEVAAGSPPLQPHRGTAIRIMTGAPVPEDNDFLQVIPVEHTNIPAGPGALPHAVRIERGCAKRHIRTKGENSQPGSVVAHAGQVIDPGTLAALLSAGLTEVTVHRRPRIAVISSGDELVCGANLRPGQLPDSNGPMVAGLVGHSAEVALHHTGDSPAELDALLAELAPRCDLIITTGGVSAGAFDVTREVLDEHADLSWFGEVAHKPGAPQGMAVWDGTPIVCLPGNPVAAFVSFHLYLTPVIAAVRGEKNTQQPTVPAIAATDFPRPRPGRTVVVPVRTRDGIAHPYARYSGSHFVSSLGGVNGLVFVEAEPILAGQTVPVTMIYAPHF